MYGTNAEFQTNKPPNISANVHFPSKQIWCNWSYLFSNCFRFGCATEYARKPHTYVKLIFLHQEWNWRGKRMMEESEHSFLRTGLERRRKLGANIELWPLTNLSTTIQLIQGCIWLKSHKITYYSTNCTAFSLKHEVCTHFMNIINKSWDVSWPKGSQQIRTESENDSRKDSSESYHRDRNLI